MKDAAAVIKNQPSTTPSATATNAPAISSPERFDLDPDAAMEPAEDSDATTEANDRTTLAAKLAETDSLLASLKRLPTDHLVQQLIDAKTATKQKLQEQLRATRPLELRLRKGLEELDRLRKKHKRLQEEEADLQTLLTAKEQEKNTAHDSMAAKQLEVDALMAAKQTEAETEDDGKDALMSAQRAAEPVYRLTKQQMEEYLALQAARSAAATPSASGHSAATAPITRLLARTPDGVYTNRGTPGPAPPYPDAVAEDAEPQGPRPFRIRGEHRARVDPYDTPQRAAKDDGEGDGAALEG